MISLRTIALAAFIAASLATDSHAGDPPPAPEKTAEVATSADAAKPIAVGARAPEAKVLSATDAKEVDLSSILAGKPTLLVFYRGGWCPYCTAHLAQLGSIQGDLKAMGIQTVAISPDSPAHAKEAQDKGSLSYTVLSDPDGAALKAFGVAFHLDDATAEKYKGYGVDLEERSGGRTHRMLPVPSAFLIDAEGVVRFAHSNPDYSKRIDPQTILEAAKSIAPAKEQPAAK